MHARLALVLVSVLAIAANDVEAITIDFDDVTAGSTGTLFPGSQYSASGVTFTSGTVTVTPIVGGTITLTSTDSNFLIIGNSNSISTPNFAAASGVFTNPNDLLLSFSTAVTSVQLTPDDATEGAPDVIRLLALAATGNPNEYEVLEIASALDDDSTPMSVTNGGQPFSFALFQVTTNAEGFDDLTFQPIPEPGTGLLLGLGLLLLGLRRP